MTLDLSKPVQTRGGQKARIVCTDTAGPWPITAMIEYNNGREYPHLFAKSGAWQHDKNIMGANALMNISAPKRYVNVYQYAGFSMTHPTPESAEKANRRAVFADAYLGTVEAGQYKTAEEAAAALRPAPAAMTAREAWDVYLAGKDAGAGSDLKSGYGTVDGVLRFLGAQDATRLKHMRDLEAKNRNLTAEVHRLLDVAGERGKRIQQQNAELMRLHKQAPQAIELSFQGRDFSSAKKYLMTLDNTTEIVVGNLLHPLAVSAKIVYAK